MNLIKRLLLFVLLFGIIAGTVTGSAYDSFVKERFPNAERKYYSVMTTNIQM